MNSLRHMFVRYARVGVAVYSALVTLLLVVSRVESLASSTSRAEDLRDPESFRFTLHVRGPGDRPLPSRVRIVPATWSDRLRLAQFEDVRVVAARGELTLAIRRGSYRVFVSHGPEWSLSELAIAAAPDASVERTIRLTHEVSLEGWQGADLHVHTATSRDAAAHGGVDASDLIAEGVDYAAITDHNHIGALPGLDSVAGAEITTWAPEIGHFNAFPLRELPQWHGTNPEALLAELARDPAVFVQINHPRLEHHIAYFKLGGFDGVRFHQPGFHMSAHGLEVWNGYDLARPDQVRAILGEWRGWLARGERITATGGSDSHGVRGHIAGYPRTYTRAARADGLATELRAGRAFVTNGPLLELRANGREPGDSLHVPSGEPIDVELRVLAPSWMQVETLELWADDALAWTAAIPVPAAGEKLEFAASFKLATRATVLHAVAHGGRGLEALLGRNDVEPLAFTNAVYLTHPDPRAERLASAGGTRSRATHR